MRLNPISESPKFFPESERTGPPVGGRRTALAVPVTGPDSASVAGAGGGEMTMVSSKAAKDNALFGRIRQSSHCQQEEQSRAAAQQGWQGR